MKKTAKSDTVKTKTPRNKKASRAHSEEKEGEKKDQDYGGINMDNFRRNLGCG